MIATQDAAPLDAPYSAPSTADKPVPPANKPANKDKNSFFERYKYVIYGGGILAIGIVAYPIIRGMGKVFGGAGDILGAVGGAADVVVEAADELVDGTAKLLREAYQGVKDAAKWCKEKLEAAYDAIGDAIQWLWDWFGKIKHYIKEGWRNVKGALVGIWDMLFGWTL